MGDVENFLRGHLHPLAGPYLFVGAGLSRRYAGLGDWQGLLAHFADKTDKSFDYYRGAADNDFPRIASLIAESFFDKWWTEDEFSQSVENWGEYATSRDSPLKYEVAQYTQAAIESLVLPPDQEAEFELLKKATIDGVITTNYDRLLEQAFPEFRPFVGQDELLFSDTQGIAEIYYIHGCAKLPSSLVLTERDYEDFNARNSYLAAKLLTIFVEHPVVFLGYSLGDPNIQAILESIIVGLRKENVSKLQDRLIFIEWDETAAPSITTTVMNISGVSLPIIRATVPDFVEVFTALGGRERAIPARVMRLLKEQIFELVQKNDPDGRLVAVSDIEGAAAADLDVVFGVGAKMTSVGIVGLTRNDLVDDLLESPDRNLPADMVLSRVISKHSKTTYVPVFKYLVGSELWDKGKFVAKTSLNPRVRDRAASVDRRFAKLKKVKDLKDLPTLEAEKGWEWVFNKALELPALTDDVEGLGAFLLKHRGQRTNNWWGTQFAKAAVAYDWMRYGRA